MNIIFNFLNSPSGYVLGYAGIAITFLVTGIIAIVTMEKRCTIVATILGTVVFIYLTWRVASNGVVTHVNMGGVVRQVDAGQALAYLGIGAGLICTGLTTHLKKKAWIADAMEFVGLIFVLFGYILSGEYNPEVWILISIGVIWIVFDLVKRILLEKVS